MDFKKDYYAILGVARSATKQEIKSAFRDLAKKFHPDKNPGDAGADDRFKEINLAYEVLGNDIARAVYDEYKIKEEQLKQSQPKTPTDNVCSANKKTYTKVSKVQKEHRVYITGDILIKYWADPLNNISVFSNWQADYKIVPFDVHIRIKDSDIHNYPGMPVDFQKAYTAADLFAVPLSQPVECSVEIAGEEEFYALELHDVRIKNPVITNVTLHDNQVMATMTGDVYAYTLKLTEEEVTEEVTECFGETGRHETKTENNNKYTRTEYFHADCSTYWGPWQPVPDDEDERGRPKRKVKPVNTDTITGCLGYWWLIPLSIFAIALPQLALGIFLFCVGIWFIGLLMNLASSFRGLLGVLAILFLVGLLYAVITGGKGRRGSPWVTTPRKAYDTLVTEEKNIRGEHTNDTTDQLISHHIWWKDYDSTRYATTLSILRSEVNAAQLSHEGINYIPEQTLAPVYDRLATMDEMKMERTYRAFDSIKNRASLDEHAFANMVVSCIQSIPYYLVVDQSCNAEQYQNAFITQYLNQCDRDCCIGYSKYGVRSPAEFIGDLKGDCDTRALIIYSLLKHFNYNVALLTSTYYQHAIVAVAFTDGQATEGIAMPIRNRNYLLWETTQAGFRAGEIPPAYQDLDYWSVDLLHEKK